MRYVSKRRKELETVYLFLFFAFLGIVLCSIAMDNIGIVNIDLFSVSVGVAVGFIMATMVAISIRIEELKSQEVTK
ncbi:hypothetical protein DRO69_00390 [Candidatus Bathyarchaeota archaeon]|nr:MAG: hypothetical protein DRO69_00390 [Candidatus Bathyarchaeota archaeon]